MKDTQTVAIVLLAVTAIILGTVLVGMTPEPARAADATRLGNYLMATVRANGNRELVYVVNVSAQRVIVYGLDINKNEVVNVAALDLRQVFAK